MTGASSAGGVSTAAGGVSLITRGLVFGCGFGTGAGGTTGCGAAINVATTATGVSAGDGMRMPPVAQSMATMCSSTDRISTVAIQRSRDHVRLPCACGETGKSTFVMALV
jgi:hypothetical protein